MSLTPVVAATTTAPVTAGAMSRRGLVGYGLLVVLGVVLTLTTPPGDATIRLATGDEAVSLPNIVVPGPLTVGILALAGSAVAAYAFVAGTRGRHVGTWPGIVSAALLLLAFLVQLGSGKAQLVTLTGILAGTLFIATPLVFGALSGVVCERVGIVNIAIEGQLLAGAFLGAVTASLTANALSGGMEPRISSAVGAYVGLVAAPIAGAGVGALLALFSIKYRVNQIIVGVVLNVLVIGLTSFLFSTTLSDNEGWNDRTALPTIEIPLLSQIPVIGPVLFRQTILVYLMYVAVIVLQIYLFRSRWGLRLRAVGEHPRAADTVGIDVNRTRWRNTILGSAIAGLGGAYFTIASGLAFRGEMTDGKGYIALAAMILGRWSPKGALAAALMFGFADNLRIVLPNLGVALSPQLLLMIPYIVTILAVAGFAGRVRAPAAEGVPYVK